MSLSRYTFRRAEWTKHGGCFSYVGFEAEHPLRGRIGPWLEVTARLVALDRRSERFPSLLTHTDGHGNVTVQWRCVDTRVPHVRALRRILVGLLIVYAALLLVCAWERGDAS